ncbi:hypothetical protein BDV34DRAFT_221986 [Aspergillus parasiticus]|uniref:Uncharacterized protein n=1 Tax=Aspergillus parasiticus TaxID=5067 RepID=A0A5N6DVB6_ASPPA|nr:hypothetical protein BDV34DRAFT_221986 [Aspergillus parasiticus]
MAFTRRSGIHREILGIIFVNIVKVLGSIFKIEILVIGLEIVVASVPDTEITTIRQFLHQLDEQKQEWEDLLRATNRNGNLPPARGSLQQRPRNPQGQFQSPEPNQVNGTERHRDGVVNDDDTVMEDVGLSADEIDIEMEEATDADDDMYFDDFWDATRAGKAQQPALE